MPNWIDLDDLAAELGEPAPEPTETEAAVQRVLARLDALGRQAHQQYNESPDGPFSESRLIARDQAFLEAARIVVEELDS
jgi:hypothetical protein